MRYFEKRENGVLIAVGTGDDGTPITRQRYEQLLQEIGRKAELVQQLLEGVCTPEQVPQAWRRELLDRAELERQLQTPEA